MRGQSLSISTNWRYIGTFAAEVCKTQTRGRLRELIVPPDDTAGNLPFGVTNDTSYVMSEALLAESEVLLIYSDGVLEAPSPAGDLFGNERLRATLGEIGNADPVELKRGVIERLRNWTGGSLDHDDVTLMAIQLDEHGGAHAE